MVRLRGHQADASLQAVETHGVVQASQLALAVGAGGAAHHQQAGVAVVLAQPDEGLHRHAEALQGLDAAHEEQHRLVSQSQSGPSAPARPS